MRIWSIREVRCELEKAIDSITIKMNKLKDLAQNLAEFLRERVGVDVVVQDDGLKVNRGEGITARRLKVYLKRFLHIEGLRRKYRVLVKGSEINFVELEVEE